MNRLAGLALLLLALMIPGAALAEWREAETPHFRIQSGGGEDRLIRFAERLEMLDALLRKATGTPADLPSTKVRVILLDTQEQVQQAHASRSDGIAGFYRVNMHGTLAVAPRHDSETASLPYVVLFHEYAHHFMLQYAPAAYPGWYIEGFAEIAGTAEPVPGGKMAWGKAASLREAGLTYSRWVPVAQLLGHNTATFPKDADFYGQSWVLAHYLTFSAERAGQLRRYLALLASGRPQAEAAMVFGDLDALNREVRAYLANRSFPYRAVPIERPSRESIRIRLLSPGEAALIEEAAAFRDNFKAEDKAKWLARVRSRAARLPDDPYALRFLADAEYVAGEQQAARAAVDRLLAVAPNDVAGRTRKAMILLKEAETLSGAPLDARIAEARKLILAANRTDPDDPQTLIAYFESYRVSGERPPPVAVDGLRQAVGTIPQDDRPRMLLAAQLANEGKLAEAIFYLGPVAYDPHPSEGQQAALGMINRLREAMAAQAKAAPTPR